MNKEQALFEYLVRIADNALILGHRISEWCGHGPSLETDIGMTNISLDYIGHARNLYQYAVELEGKNRTEDDLAYLRDVPEFKNLLLVEQPNEDFAYTIARQFVFDTFNYHFFEALQASTDERLAGIAKKSIKEITYHYRWSAEWIIRLGDGTTVSHEKIQEALDDLWMYSGEAFIADEIDQMLLAEGIGVDLSLVQSKFDERVSNILQQATLTLPVEEWMQEGGKQGKHTEHLGLILTELQWMQRAYPNMEW
jgi:ring-1,2-phenylacetyl-CoA epoxidase subunit PaaC